MVPSIRTRSRTVVQALAMVMLGLGFLLFFTSYPTASLYYSPAIAIALLVLSLLIVILGYVESIAARKKSGYSIGHRATLLTRVVTKIQGMFWKVFALAWTLTLSDMGSTAYAISKFGISLERNRLIAELVSRGDYYTWVGQQLSPLIVAGAAFALMNRRSIRTTITFYVLGTAGYAAGIVVNNMLVILRLTF